VLFEEPAYITIQLQSGGRKYYAVSLNTVNHKIILSDMNNPAWQRVLTTSESAPDVVSLESKGEGVPAHLKMHKLKDTQFVLKSRGFNWINEYPFNR
jgi:hypothetical protein